jgi:hypothetical protein
MGGVDYGEALKKIETAIANKDKANAAAGVAEKIDSSSTVKNETDNLDFEEDNHDDLYN